MTRLAVAVVLSLALCAPSVASAAFPGADGPIAFAGDPAHGAGASLFKLSGSTLSPFRSAGSQQAGPAVSPDGRWIAYALGVTIYVEPFPETGAKYQVWEAGIHPAWSPDGKELFSPDRRGLRVMAMAMRPTVTFTSEPDLPRPFTEGGPAAVRPYDMMRDGQHYIAVTNLQDVRSDPQFRVVLNWLDELKTRLPAE
jgi:hypothetical protein